ncbi:unnamed protein product [Caenorhabditis sp. 36 PRJEB53466]|nr:unnamed protein product [Caenorhabditis sp. 36 PRJEB53466]
MVTLIYSITVSTVVLGGSAQFYSYGVVNPAQTVISNWINQTYITRYNTPLTITVSNILWSFIVSSIATGAIVGASLTRVVGEKCGRRNGLIYNGILNTLAAFLELSAKWLNSPEVLIIGRFIFGMNMGLSSGLIPMYLMEITPAKYRGPAGTLHQIAEALKTGHLHFRCQESPKYTLRNRRDRTRAMKDVEHLVGEDQAPHMFESIVREVALDEGEGTFHELFRRQDLRIPLIVSIVVMIAQQFTGCTAVFAYSTDMFYNAGLDLALARSTITFTVPIGKLHAGTNSTIFVHLLAKFSSC